MKRKPTLIIVSLVAAFTLLAVTAFASAPDYAGYEAFKNLAQEHETKDLHQENATLKGSITIKDNGVELLNLNALIKADGSEENFSGTFQIQADDVNKEIDVYSEGDLVYIFDEENNEFYQISHEEQALEDYDNEHYKSGSYDKEMTPAEEELMDFIIGDLKDDFELINNADGSETIAFELKKDEMPMLLNLMFSAMDHRKSDMKEDNFDTSEELLAKYPLLNDLKNIEVDMPEIVENMELDYVRFAITKDSNNELQSVDFSFIVTGKDEAGLNHTQQISGKFQATDMGTTVIDEPVLEGKNIIIVDEEDFGHEDSYQMHMGSKGRR